MNIIEKKYMQILGISSGIILLVCILGTSWAIYQNKGFLIPTIYIAWGLITLLLQMILSILAKSIIIIPGTTYRYPTEMPIRQTENKKKYLQTLLILVVLFITLVLVFINQNTPDLTEGITPSFIQHNEYEINFEPNTSIITGLMLE